MNARQRRTARRARERIEAKAVARFEVVISRRAQRRMLEQLRVAFPKAVAFWGDGALTVTGRRPTPYRPPFHNFPRGRS